MTYPLPQQLQEALSSSPNKQRVVMTCGIAGKTHPPSLHFHSMSPVIFSAHNPGSGKSTLAHALIATFPNFIRLSVDACVFSSHGPAGMSSPSPQIDDHQFEAQVALKAQFRELLREGKRDVVLDFSFYDLEYRDEWRDIIQEETEKGDVKVLLVFFDAEEEVLWRRIEERRLNAERRGRSADDSAVVTREMLERFVKGFERPGEDEDAIVVKVE
jgi:predicted kinase